jgi:hypothetical protein
MNRSVRNGLAIAGMAGGLFFLGQAVASADEQVADAANSVDQSASTEGGGGNFNGNLSEAEATNVQVTEVTTNVSGGNGGSNSASINTGIESGPSTVPLAQSVAEEPGGGGTTVNVETGDVSLTQEANGGDVNGSGNVAVAGGGDQTAVATNEVSQSATSEDDGHGWPQGGGGGWENGGPTALNSQGGGHDEGGNANLNASSAEATNIDITEVSTNVYGGNGGVNQAEINTGIIDNTFYCPEYSTCTFNFTTGDVTVHQSANGGDVNGSGNVAIGTGPWPWSDGHEPGAKPGDCPKAEHQPEVKPAARPAVKPAAASAPLSSAQPSGQLAFTGSDVSLPLTVGLLALVAGIGLTALTRRQTATV